MAIQALSAPAPQPSLRERLQNTLTYLSPQLLVLASAITYIAHLFFTTQQRDQPPSLALVPFFKINLVQHVALAVFTFSSTVFAQTPSNLTAYECILFTPDSSPAPTPFFHNLPEINSLYISRTAQGLRLQNTLTIPKLDYARKFNLLKLLRPLGFDAPLDLLQKGYPPVTPEEKGLYRVLFYLTTETYFSQSPFCNTYQAALNCSNQTLLKKTSCAPNNTIQQIGFTGAHAGKTLLCGQRNLTLSQINHTFLLPNTTTLQPYTAPLLQTFSLRELYNLLQTLGKTLSSTETKPLKTLYKQALFLYTRRTPCEYNPCEKTYISQCYPPLRPYQKPTSSLTISNSLSETLDTNTLSDPRTTSSSQSSSRTSQTNTISLNGSLSVSSSHTLSFKAIKGPPETFGPEDWNRYFGDIGITPPLPWNITAILGSPCPIWGNTSLNSLKVQDTHLLTLIPKIVNGTNLTLALLGQIVQKPQGGGNKTQYRYFNLGQAADTPPLQSYWVLMTKDVIPNSRAQSYTKQLQLLQNYTGYEVPKRLEAVTTLFMHYVKTGKRVYYTDSPWTWTRCQEKYDATWQTCVGGFAPAGLGVSSGNDDVGNVGLGALRKF